jgi:nitrite reductase/ring-hydroxylating ferredoxin subunit
MLVSESSKNGTMMASVSDTLENKQMTIKVVEDSHGEEILIFPHGEVIYAKDAVCIMKDEP